MTTKERNLPIDIKKRRNGIKNILGMLFVGFIWMTYHIDAYAIRDTERLKNIILIFCK